MGALLGLAGELFKALIGPLMGALEKWGIYQAGRKQGRAEQAVADLKETATTVRKANEGRSRVGTSDDDVDRLLRPPGARGR